MGFMLLYNRSFNHSHASAARRMCVAAVPVMVLFVFFFQRLNQRTHGTFQDCNHREGIWSTQCGVTLCRAFLHRVRCALCIPRNRDLSREVRWWCIWTMHGKIVSALSTQPEPMPAVCECTACALRCTAKALPTHCPCTNAHALTFREQATADSKMPDQTSSKSDASSSASDDKMELDGQVRVSRRALPQTQAGPPGPDP